MILKLLGIQDHLRAVHDIFNDVDDPDPDSDEDMDEVWWRARSRDFPASGRCL